MGTPHEPDIPRLRATQEVYLGLQEKVYKDASQQFVEAGCWSQTSHIKGKDQLCWVHAWGLQGS